jgi:hypothetical protein
LCSTFFQSCGVTVSGFLRVLRRSLPNTVVGERLARLDVAGVAGAVAMCSRLGGWLSSDNGQSATLWNTYVSTNTDSLASHLAHANAGRTLDPHISDVRAAAVAPPAAGAGAAGDEAVVPGGAGLACCEQWPRPCWRDVCCG